MEASEMVRTEGRDAEEKHGKRLMTLLHELVRREGGRRGVARALGIDRRTVTSWMDGPINGGSEVF